MGFDVAAESYDRFMGRYSRPLAPQLADFAGVAAGQRVLDVGCGPGALTAELVARLGAGAVAAVDPVGAVRRRGRASGTRAWRSSRPSAEELPFPDDAFDAALAQLVVHFMADPVAGLREMARVTRAGRRRRARASGTTRAAAGRSSVFWEAARALDPDVDDESQLAGAREGHLAELFGAAGLAAIEDRRCSVAVEHPSFEDWWEPFTLGVGPAGCVRRRPGRGSPGGAPRGLPRGAPAGAVRPQRPRLGSPGPRLGRAGPGTVRRARREGPPARSRAAASSPSGQTRPSVRPPGHPRRSGRCR